MITLKLVLFIHSRLIVRFGGSEGIRDMGGLQSALTRPENVAYYKEKATVFDQAAALTYGLIKNHPFVDGNKRVAALMCELFLEEQGYELNLPEEEKYFLFTGLAASQISEEEFGSILKKKSKRIKNG